MEFNSQICTTEEQSKQLLALGLKKKTADMHYYHTVDFEDNEVWSPSVIPYNNMQFNAEFVGELNIIENDIIPAWSLHRLIEMCNNTQVGMTIGIYNDEVTVDGDLFEVYDNTYDNLISIIEWLIKLGHFNKNYLDIH